MRDPLTTFIRGVIAEAIVEAEPKPTKADYERAAREIVSTYGETSHTSWIKPAVDAQVAAGRNDGIEWDRAKLTDAIRKAYDEHIDGITDDRIIRHY